MESLNLILKSRESVRLTNPNLELKRRLKALPHPTFKYPRRHWVKYLFGVTCYFQVFKIRWTTISQDLVCVEIKIIFPVWKTSASHYIILTWTDYEAISCHSIPRAFPWVCNLLEVVMWWSIFCLHDEPTNATNLPSLSNFYTMLTAVRLLKALNPVLNIPDP